MSTADLALRQQRGKRLQALRKACGLSAEALAQAMTNVGAPVSRGAISNWERGENGIVIDKLPTLWNFSMASTFFAPAMRGVEGK